MLDLEKQRALRVVAGRRLVQPDSFPTHIAGHGANAVAMQAADPLEVNALLLRAGGRRCLMAAFDLLYIGGALERQLRAALAQRFGLDRSEVLLFASHTHFAPPTDGTLPALGPMDSTYADKVRDAAINLFGSLLADPGQVCHVETRRGLLSSAVNRRRPRIAPTFTRSGGFSFDRVTLGPHESGARDDTATLVRLVRNDTREPVAHLWHYACHPVARVPANVTSADFPGVARNTLRLLEGGDLPVLFLQGFCGNLRPNAAPRPPSSFVEAALGLARGAISGLSGVYTDESGWQSWVAKLETDLTAIARSPPRLMKTPHCIISEHGSMPLGEVFDGKLTRETLHLWAMRLGPELEIFAFGAAPTVEWQSRLDAALGAAPGVRLYAAYCGDVFGYLPVPEQLDEGGYEVSAFQSAFGMDGSFSRARLGSRVDTAIKALACHIDDRCRK
jgi:hypothetical protein